MGVQYSVDAGFANCFNLETDVREILDTGFQNIFNLETSIQVILYACSQNVFNLQTGVQHDLITNFEELHKVLVIDLKTSVETTFHFIDCSSNHGSKLLTFRHFAI